MKMKNRDLYIRNGDIIAVGRERFKYVRKAILNYWGVQINADGTAVLYCSYAGDRSGSLDIWKNVSNEKKREREKKSYLDFVYIADIYYIYVN